MNRRNFCASSVATAISVAAAGLVCGFEPPRPGVRLYKYLYDGRYAAARAFGLAGARADSIAGTIAINGDVTALWVRDLRGQWLAGGGAIAGMTTARTLFCLEQLARDHWMRVVIRADHALVDGRDIAHRLTAPAAMVNRLRSALSDGNWPAQLPAALATWRRRDNTRRMTTMFTSAVRHRWASTHPALVSFVIA